MQHVIVLHAEHDKPASPQPRVPFFICLDTLRMNTPIDLDYE